MRALTLTLVVQLLAIVGCSASQGSVDEAERHAEDFAGGSFVLVARHSGKALDVTGASTADGANVQQWSQNGTAAQIWKFEPTGDGYYLLRSQASGKALDVTAWSTAEGANVEEWTAHGGANQQWKLIDAGGGFYRVQSRHSGKFLDVAWGSTADGANVAQVNWYDSAAQQWKLVPASAPPPAGSDWKLVWNDEFDGSGLPASDKWSYDVGGSGWGNSEAEYYTDRRLENARLEGGKLVIEAREEEYGGMHYTSARLVSRDAGNWLYGRFEIRAKIPAARGTWPAIWMLPTDWKYGGWPDSGEIDIMEHVGYDPNVIHATTHTKAYNWVTGTQKTATTVVPDATTAFHTYACEWSADRVDVFVDDHRYFSFANEHSGPAAWPFDQRFHLILNVAVGGSWGGVKGIDDGAFPQRMEIDYVRAYRR
jgi:beta-glucanase (GH16 family)